MWRTVAGCGRDIGVNDSGQVIVRGCSDNKVYRGRMSANATDADLNLHRNDGFVVLGPMGGGPELANSGLPTSRLRRIAVRPDGRPYVLASDGKVYTTTK